MTKNEYMSTINEKLNAAENLCTNLRKLRILQKLTKDIPNAVELVSSEALSKAIADKETELKAVRSELQKARRIVKKMEEIEAIEAGIVPTPDPKKRAAKKPATKNPIKSKTERATKEPQATTQAA